MSARSFVSVGAALALVLGSPAACNQVVGNGDVGPEESDSGGAFDAATGGEDAGYAQGDDAGGADSSVVLVSDAGADAGSDDAGNDAGAVEDAGADVDAGPPPVCVDGGSANACHECGPLDASPGEPCGAPSTCGALQCAGDGGGLVCNDLSSQLGAACGANGCGTTACSADGTSVVCTGDHAKNACGGCSALAAENGASASGAPGDPCGSCDSGQTVCQDQNTLTCIGATTNACGGCGTLAGTPNTSCGTCSGIWTCSSDKSSVTCTGDHAENACGGCSTLSPADGTGCSNGTGSCLTTGSYTCSGLNATACSAPQPPAPSTWGTTEWNGSWDRNCDGTVEYSPSNAQFIEYSAAYPNGGTQWAASATAICATGSYACNRVLSDGTVSQWLYYPAYVENYPACGENYIQFRCTLQSGKCMYVEDYCQGSTFNDLTSKCTIRNDVQRQCE